MMRSSPASALQRFQDGFARALIDRSGPADAEGELAYLVSQPGFAVYRNTVMKGCIDALQANYPAVHGFVGDEWFRAAAGVFVRTHLPWQPVLLEYGEAFAVFLDAFPPAAEVPGLAQLARLDRYWTEAHIAHDEAPVAALAVARLAAAQLAGAVLHPHASARWCCFDEKPVVSTWRGMRGFDAPPDETESAGLLIVRPHDVVRAPGLDWAGCAFLDACAEGGTLADAAHAALAADPHTDLSLTMARLLDAGAFGRLTLPDPIQQEDRS